MRRLLLLAGFALFIAVQPAEAAMLEADACARLKSEQALLDGRGARASLAAGPSVAGRLSPQQLDDVRRLVEVDEQVLFRCPLPPPPKAAAKSPATEKGATEAGEKAKPAPKLKPKTADAAEAPKPAPKVKTADPSADAAKSPPKAAPKPAQKVDDAYRP